MTYASSYPFENTGKKPFDPSKTRENISIAHERFFSLITIDTSNILRATPNNSRLIISRIIGILMKISVIASFFDFSDQEDSHSSPLGKDFQYPTLPHTKLPHLFLQVPVQEYW